MEERIVYPEPDPKDPYRNVYTGQIDVTYENAEGKECSGLLYIPTTEMSAWNMILVLLDKGQCAKEYFAAGNWEESLEKHAVTALFAEAPEGYSCCIETAVKNAEKALEKMQKVEYFQNNAPGVYCLGVGEGAKVAAAYAAQHADVLAAWAAWGDTALPAEYLEKVGAEFSDRHGMKTRSQEIVPTMLIDGETNALEFFKKANNTGDMYYYTELGRVYMQQPKRGQSYRNSSNDSRVWLLDPAKAEAAGLPAMVETIVSTLEDFKRWGGEGCGHIKHTIYLEKDGLIPYEQEIGGRLRRWLVYVPDSIKREIELGSTAKYPAVMAIHGFTCHGLFFANTSGWNEVAEDRRCIVIYPTAYVGTGWASRNHFPTHEWNCGSWPPDGEPDPNGPDEVAFLVQVVQQMIGEYPIDAARVYVSGHSNGSVMTQRLMRDAAGTFAGFGPVGAMENFRGFMKDMPADGIPRNVWYVIGEFDGAGCSLEDPNSGNVTTIEKLCKHNGVKFADRHYYESGIYMNTVISTETGVPMVRFTGVKNWPHTYNVEVAYMLYDEFFAKFERRPDGELVYKG